MRIEPQALTGANLTINGIKCKGALVEADLPEHEFITKEVAASIGKKEIVLPTLKPQSLKVVVNAVDNAMFKLAFNPSLKRTLIVLENNISDNDKNTSYKIVANGKIKKITPPKIAMEEEIKVEIELSCYAYTELINLTPAFLYDVDNEILMPDGITDIYAEIRSNI
ncbi:phage major tail tube protein [Campylobacter sp. RM12637]|uniref:phage major tail tube protein n=1 Tax=Campylobacter sp. RM12637 TaxID=2735734 RepID=UPI0030149BA7|nr:phage major tail tube protein [Campylobacter sp. RM12637]